MKQINIYTDKIIFGTINVSNDYKKELSLLIEKYVKEKGSLPKIELCYNCTKCVVEEVWLSFQRI